MIRVLILIFTIFLNLGCSFGDNSKFKVPKPKEMAQILAEVHLAESTLATLSVTHPTATHNSYYKSVLAMHGLTKIEFDSAVAYYSSQPAEYEKIYENVIEILTAKELEVKALKDEIKVVDAKSKPGTTVFDANNFWGSNRSIVINSADSTRLNSRFEIFTDSILGGSVTLTVKCHLKSTLKMRGAYKNSLKVEYSDGKIDSTSTTISSKILFKDLSTTLKLSNRKVKRVFGSLIVLNPKDIIVADFVDIRLMWSRPTAVGKLNVNLKTVR